MFNAVQSKAGGEGDGDEVQKGLQEAKPAPAVEDIQSGVCVHSPQCNSGMTCNYKLKPLQSQQSLRVVARSISQNDPVSAGLDRLSQKTSAMRVLTTAVPYKGPPEESLLTCRRGTDVRKWQ